MSCNRYARSSSHFIGRRNAIASALPVAGTHHAIGQNCNAIEVIIDDDLMAELDQIEDDYAKRPKVTPSPKAGVSSPMRQSLATYSVAVVDRLGLVAVSGSPTRAVVAVQKAQQATPIRWNLLKPTNQTSTHAAVAAANKLSSSATESSSYGVDSPATEVIYVLRCEQDKYYVGKTRRDLMSRILEHLSQRGSAWTSRYAPLEAVHVRPISGNFDEDTVTKEFMSLFGIENVRGGTYCNIDLQPAQVAVLQQEIRSSKNQCLRCGSAEHFVNLCDVNTDNTGKRTTSKVTSASWSPFKSYFPDTRAVVSSVEDRGGGGFAEMWSDGPLSGSLFRDPLPDD
jgi:predicted GIY-YIG superfamily endonuclease